MHRRQSGICDRAHSRAAWAGQGGRWADHLCIPGSSCGHRSPCGQSFAGRSHGSLRLQNRGSCGHSQSVFQVCHSAVVPSCWLPSARQCSSCTALVAAGGTLSDHRSLMPQEVFQQHAVEQELSSKFGRGVSRRCMPWVQCPCSAPRPPREENVLYLNGESSGLVNNACFPSTVAPSYASAGQASYCPSPHLPPQDKQGLDAALQ